MENKQEIQWHIGGGGEAETARRLPYVPPWKTFSKLPDEEKERIFNDMRGGLILAGRMDNK